MLSRVSDPVRYNLGDITDDPQGNILGYLPDAADTASSDGIGACSESKARSDRISTSNPSLTASSA
jgi:hypothetical protein